MAEGALSRQQAAAQAKQESVKKKKDKEAASQPESHELALESASVRLARQLQEITHLEARVTALGHLQRGGVPSPTDRLLATQLGTKCAELIEQGTFGVMVAVRGHKYKPVPLSKVAGRRKTVPLDHPWIRSARLVGTSFGDCARSD
jgi:6-phosphofructokinase 1